MTDTIGRLNDIVEYVRKNSPFYADIYSCLPERIDDVIQLPIVDHTAYWKANNTHDNRLLTAPLTEAVVFKSGGTTGDPKFSCFTRTEWDHLAAQLGEGLVECGLRKGHRVANLFYVGELYGSFFMFHDCLTRVEVDSVRLPIGGATTVSTVRQLLNELGAEVIGGTPTTLCALANDLVADGGSMPKVDILFFAGEPVYSDQRRLLSVAFPNAAICSAAYVSVDAGLLGHPMRGDDQRVFRAPREDTLLEIVDDTGEPIREAGRSGRVIKTDLARRLMPVLRYPVGDRAEWVDPDLGLFRVLGRHEEGVRVGLVSLYAEDVRAVIAQADLGAAVVGIQLVVRHWDGKDGLRLRLATAPGTANTERLAATIISEVGGSRPMYSESVNAGYLHPLAIEWVTPDELVINPRSGKTLRVVDERPLV